MEHEELYVIAKKLNIALPILIGLLYFTLNNERKTLLMFLGFYFLYTGVGEWVALVLSEKYPTKGNLNFYDKFFIPSSYLLQYTFFYFALKNKNLKVSIIILSIIYLLCFLIEKLMIDYEHGEFSWFSYCVGSLIVIVSSLFYLLTLVKSAAIVHFKSDTAFWFSIGSLFFQLFTFPFFALMNIWREDKTIFFAYYDFMFICIYISYIFYTMGILWSRKK